MTGSVDKLTRSHAIAHAAKYGLQREVVYLMDHKNLTPEEALSKLDIL